MLIYINFFHVNTHEISLKIIIQRSWWICLAQPSLAYRFGFLPCIQKSINREQIWEITTSQVPMQGLQIYRAQRNRLVPLSPVTPQQIGQTSLHGTSSLPLCTGPGKSTRDSVFRGDKPHTVLKHTQELVTSHEYIGLSSETPKWEEGRERRPLTGTNDTFLQVTITYH